jgi:hypothetical protein
MKPLDENQLNYIQSLSKEDIISLLLLFNDNSNFITSYFDTQSQKVINIKKQISVLKLMTIISFL